MALNRSREVFPKSRDLIRPFSGEEYPFPPWLFQHQDLIQMLEGADTIDQKSLINIFNRLHFMDGHVLVQLDHLNYEESILVRAFPRPCHGKMFTCLLSKKNIAGLELTDYKLTHLIVDDGQIMIVVPVESQEIERNVISIQIPEKGYITGRRKSRRYLSKGINAEIIQNGFRISGKLLDFSPHGLRVKISPESSSSFHWFNSGISSTIHLQNDQQMFFSSACKYIRRAGKIRDQEIVLNPINEKSQRIKKKRSRNSRKIITPSPTLEFKHPFLKRNTQLDVYNISTSGFSVYENSTEQLLIPGMIIPSVIIRFSGGLDIRCDAQVIYNVKEKKGIRCGLTVLNMEVKDYVRLTQILASGGHDDIYVAGDADMEALWEFFFDSGFIYPKKYRMIHSNKEVLKDTYQKVYQNHPEIAKQFIYRKNGKVYGNISMVRAYERSWMIHHYASKVIENRRKGFIVLQQIVHYLNDLYRLPSAKMDYLMAYFRPENRIPERVFGGFAEHLGDLQSCSMDLFAYFSYPADSLGLRLPEGWLLKEISSTDLWKLNRFYRNTSGGLLLDIMSLEKDESIDEPLNEVYRKLGLLREWKAFSLLHEGRLNAVLIVDQSNLGINFSELLNSIKIIVINSEDMPWNILSHAIAQLTSVYQSDRVPVLIYPVDYLKAMDVLYEKKYKLWIMNVQCSNEWIEYIEKRFRLKNLR
ncbi:hypothetical protein ACFL1Z_01640 [Thermodesulfobacteriota bacterium]